MSDQWGDAGSLGVTAGSAPTRGTGAGDAGSLGVAGPIPVPQLSRQQMSMLQAFLTNLGYSPGVIDGLWGPKTNAAWLKFAADNGINGTSITPTLLQKVQTGDTGGLKTGPSLNSGVSVYDQYGVNGGVQPSATAAPDGSTFGDGTLSGDELQRIREAYPSMAHLLDIPEIFQLLSDSLKGSGWSDAQMTLAIEETNWFKTTSASQRQYDASAQRDPATVEENIRRQALQLEKLANLYGVTADAGTLRDASVQILRNGYDDNQILRMVGDMARGQLFAQAEKGEQETSGQLASMKDTLRAQARAYHLSFSDDQLDDWAIRIVEGRASYESAEAVMRQQARQLYPALSKQIDEGFTVEDYFAPTKAKLAQLLDVNPNTIDLTSEKYSQVTQLVDDRGNIRPMTHSELGKFARSQQEWWATDAAAEKGYGMLNGLLRTMGAIK